MSDAESALPEFEAALKPGTRLGEFEIRRQLGSGGFGIVYLAFDHALEREVAIKEYMPAAMAGRTQALHVSLRSRSDAEVFALGLRSFINEAKLLARFDHPSLIKVHRFWEANDTAYMVMPVLRGPTFQEIRRSTGRGPDEGWVRSVLAPLLEALEQLHNEGVYHRDISPDNIHLEAGGRPVLLDFGAARRVISGKTQTLTAILKPAYAPIEQYAETSDVKQGPWTDIYALGATLHYMLLGHPPAPATARAVGNEATVLTRRGAADCSPQLLGLIDWMLAPRPADRPQSAAEVRAVLEGRRPLPRRAAQAPASALREAAPPMVTVALDGAAQAAAQSAVRAMDVRPAPVGHAGLEPLRRGSQDVAGATDALRADVSQRLPPPPSRSRWLPVALAGVVLAGLLAYAGWSRFGSLAMPGTASAGTTAIPAGVESVPVPERTPAVAAVPAASAVPATAASAATFLPGDSSVATAGASAVAVVVHEATQAASSASLGSAAGAGGSPRPVQLSRPASTGEPAVELPPRPVATSSARDGAQPPGSTPELRCGGRTPLSHFFCMERECERPRFRSHPECAAWRAQAARPDGNPGRAQPG